MGTKLFNILSTIITRLSATIDRVTILISTINRVDTRTLLWTNSNPTAGFAGQTVSTNLGFDAFEIDYIGFTSQAGYRCTEKFYTDASTSDPVNGVLTFITGAGGQVGNGLYIFKRTVMVDENAGGLTFGELYRATPTQDWARYTNNTGIVPYKIYGLKFAGSTP